MRTILLILPAAIALGQGGPAAEPALPLSMKRAVDIALAADGSPKVALAEESIRQAEARKDQARGALLPDIESSIVDQRETTNLSAFGFNSSAFPFLPPGVTFPSIVGPFSVFDARATVSQTVFDFSTIRKYPGNRRSTSKPPNSISTRPRTR